MKNRHFLHSQYDEVSKSEDKIQAGHIPIAVCSDIMVLP